MTAPLMTAAPDLALQSAIERIQLFVKGTPLSYREVELLRADAKHLLAAYRRAISEVERLTEELDVYCERVAGASLENTALRSEVERVTKERLTEWEANALLHLMNDTPESPSYDRLTEKLEAISRGAVRGDARKEGQSRLVVKDGEIVTQRKDGAEEYHCNCAWFAAEADRHFQEVQRLRAVILGVVDALQAEQSLRVDYEKLPAIIALRNAVRGDAAIREDAPEGGVMPDASDLCAECGAEWAEHIGESCPNGGTKFRAVQPPADREPRLADLFGIAPDITGGLSSEDFVRYQRAAPDFLRGLADGSGELEPSDRPYLRWVADYIERLKDALVRRATPAPADEQEFEKALDALELTLRVIGLDRKTAAKQRAARTEVMRLYKERQ